jgi:hypothetical protein
MHTLQMCLQKIVYELKEKGNVFVHNFKELWQIREYIFFQEGGKKSVKISITIMNLSTCTGSWQNGFFMRSIGHTIGKQSIVPLFENR